MSDTQKVGAEEPNIDRDDQKSANIEGVLDVNAEDNAEDNAGDNDANGEVLGEYDEQADLEKMTLLLEDARNKVDEHWDQNLRLKADIENLHRRHERELEKAHKFALDKFTQALLPVVDSLELGLNAANEDNADVAKLLIEGSELTLKLLKTALEKSGVKEINPIGEAFNPEWHQAMATQVSDKVSPNTVLTVYQKGYLLNERVVRPAMVVVAKSGEGNNSPENSLKDSLKDSLKENAETNTKDVDGNDADDSLGSKIDEQA